MLRLYSIKGVHIVFDIEEWYEDTHDNTESRGMWGEQEISDILNSCDKEKVIDLINNNEPSDFYEGIISIANSDMFSCDKRDVIKKMCGESE